LDLNKILYKPGNPDTIKKYERIKKSIEEFFKIFEYTILSSTFYLISVKLDSTILRYYSYVGMVALIIYIFIITEPYKKPFILQIIYILAYLIYGFIIVNMIMEISKVL
jgi:hypothetical protein